MNWFRMGGLIGCDVGVRVECYLEAEKSEGHPTFFPAHRPARLCCPSLTLPSDPVRGGCAGTGSSTPHGSSEAGTDRFLDQGSKKRTRQRGADTRAKVPPPSSPSPALHDETCCQRDRQGVGKLEKRTWTLRSSSIAFFPAPKRRKSYCSRRALAALQAPRRSAEAGAPLPAQDLCHHQQSISRSRCGVHSC